MPTLLEKEVRTFLKIYSVVFALFFAVFLVSPFATNWKKPKFEEIDVRTN